MSAICAMRFWAIRLCALLRANGQKVDVQNYIDNTGVQVADVVVGFLHLEGKSLAECADCWD
jgi:arginyl-tRNA synthetase